MLVHAQAQIRERAGLHRMQIAFSKRVTGPVIGLILVAGIYLATDSDAWDEPWAGISFVTLLVIAGLGATVLRRGEEANTRDVRARRRVRLRDRAGPDAHLDARHARPDRPHDLRDDGRAVRVAR